MAANVLIQHTAGKLFINLDILTWILSTRSRIGFDFGDDQRFGSLLGRALEKRVQHAGRDTTVLERSVEVLKVLEILEVLEVVETAEDAFREPLPNWRL